MLCTGLLAVMLLSIVACGGKVTGLIETYDEWKTDVPSRNKEAAASQLISYADLKQLQLLILSSLPTTFLLTVLGILRSTTPSSAKQRNSTSAIASTVR